MKTTLKSLRFVIYESVITAGILSIPIMTPFFLGLGLSQAEIALTQTSFTIAMMMLNIPLGWVADRFSRKWANIIGDFGLVAVFLLYSQVQGFVGIVVAEILCAICMAFSQGVDSSLLKHFNKKLGRTEKEFKTLSGRLAAWQFVVSAIFLALGGPIGAIDFRLAIALSGVPFLIGGIISLFIVDDSEKLVQQHKNPLKDMGRVVKDAIKDPALRWRLFAYAVSQKYTNVMVWVFTPLLLLAKVPLELVAIGWVLNYCTGAFGSLLAKKISHKLKDWQNFLLPIIFATTGYVILSIHLNIWTVWFYGLTGLCWGYSNAAIIPMVLDKSKPSEHTSVISLAKVIGQLLYIPTVWLVGVAADIKIEYSMLATLLIFVPLAMPILIKLRRE
jgi:MFS family permease